MPQTPTNQQSSVSPLDIAALVLAFLIPPAGLILGFVGIRQSRAVTGKASVLALVATIIGGLFVLIGIVIGIVLAVLAGSAVGEADRATKDAKFCEIYPQSTNFQEIADINAKYIPDPNLNPIEQLSDGLERDEDLANAEALRQDIAFIKDLNYNAPDSLKDVSEALYESLEYAAGKLDRGSFATELSEAVQEAADASLAYQAQANAFCGIG